MKLRETTSSDTGHDAPQDQQRGKQIGLIAALAVVALVIVGGVAALNVGHDNATPTTNAPVSAPSHGDSTATGFDVPATDVFGRRVDTPRNTAGQPLTQTGRGRTSTDPDWLTGAPVLPTQGGWQRVAGASVPFSTSDGPTRVADGVAAGWAHTPQGAALAAVYAGYQVNARPGSRTVRERLIINPAKGLREFESNKAAGRLPDQLPENLTRYFVAPDAFRIDSYAEDMAVVAIATRGVDNNGAPAWTATQIVMVWDGGDWRLQPPPGATPPQHVISTLTGGWIKW
ncbi:hypothetical protein HLB23_28075 [Nocardia uniformis]|uniref:DUF8175 domain-containing protein n=1 Tax=Nocardia uniformis TaxID=53432 RepID=A0A849C4N8_9NOCA|nr:hypothetical protein [Nocardia uniformis]NNH73664.1 hypothetical protein [Nocardia uniformis]